MMKSRSKDHEDYRNEGAMLVDVVVGNNKASHHNNNQKIMTCHLDTSVFDVENQAIISRSVPLTVIPISIAIVNLVVVEYPCLS
jgi:hypothetical protein